MNSEPIVIGALHMPPYGLEKPSQSLNELEDYVLSNAHVFYDNGMKRIYLQDCTPTVGKCTVDDVAIMSRMGTALKKEFPDMDLGIVMEANDGVSPIAVAHACGASFVRIKVFCGSMIKAEGVLQGVGIEAIQERRALNSNVKIYADAHDRMGLPLINIPIETISGWVARAGADVLILTGFNYAETLSYHDRCKASGIKIPTIVGGGATIGNIQEILQHCAGAVVSSSLMKSAVDQNGILWDGDKVKRFMEKVLG